MFRPAQSACVLSFDNFELDLRAGELRKGGVKLRLQGQPIQVLAALLNRSGELVTRDELRAQVWSGDTFVDFDHSLHNAIARIREVLGDSAGTPRYIETLPRRGYRFIGKVERLVPEQLPISEQAKENVEASPHAWGSHARAAVAITFFTLVALGFALWLVPTLSHTNNAGLPLRSIAVLPLDNLSGDPTQDYFVDGMTEELITDLAKVSALRVTSRTSAMRYKGTKKSLPEIARELIDQCKPHFKCFYEEKDSIGRRYRRQDAIGTPFCITIDHQTKEDQTVTIRYRDSMTQERIALADVKALVMDKIKMF